MKANDLLDVIGEVSDEHIREAKIKHKTKSWTKWLVTAACFSLIFITGWSILTRLDYHFFKAGCSAYPGKIVNGEYYYYVPHKGVMKYVPENDSELQLHTFWFEEWTVNDYGIYYWYDMSVFVRDHETGTRTKLYTASKQDCSHIRFSLTGDGNVIVTHYNKYNESVYEILIHGQTGEIIDTVMESTSYDVSKYTYYSDLNYIVGERNIVLVPVDEQKNYCLMTENGQNLLPDGLYASPNSEADYIEGALWLSIQSMNGNDSNTTEQYAILHPNGETQLVTLPSIYFSGGNLEYIFAPQNNCDVLCVEISSGESWILEMSCEWNFHDIATDGNYLYTTAPWDHIQTCWKLRCDESGKPIGLILVADDMVPS